MIFTQCTLVDLFLADSRGQFTSFYKSGFQFAALQFVTDLIQSAGELGERGGDGRLVGGQNVAP